VNGFDYGFWGFVLGAIGTIISSLLVIVQIIDRLKEPSEKRVEVLRPIFAAFHVALNDLNKALATNDTHEIGKSGVKLIDAVFFLKTKVLSLEKTIEKESKPIHDDLIPLVSRVDKILDGTRSSGEVWNVVKDDDVKKLASSLADRLNEWMEKNA